MIKLYKARSLLYRHQILQENVRWKALDEIYKIYVLLHRSDLNTKYFRTISSNFFAFFGRQNFVKIVHLNFEKNSLNFAQSLMRFFCRNFANIFEDVEKI